MCYATMPDFCPGFFYWFTAFGLITGSPTSPDRKTKRQSDPTPFGFKGNCCAMVTALCVCVVGPSIRLERCLDVEQWRALSAVVTPGHVTGRVSVGSCPPDAGPPPLSLSRAKWFSTSSVLQIKWRGTPCIWRNGSPPECLLILWSQISPLLDLMKIIEKHADCNFFFDSFIKLHACSPY